MNGRKLKSASARPYLRSIPLFKYLSPQKQLAVAEKLVHRRLAGGQILDLRAEHAQVLCIVTHGRLTVRTQHSQKDAGATTLTRGQWAGQGLLLGWQQSRRTTLTAASDSVGVLLLWKHDLATLVPFGLLAGVVRPLALGRVRLERTVLAQPALVGVLMALVLFAGFVLGTQPGKALRADWQYWWHRSRMPVPEETQAGHLARILDLRPDHALAAVELGNLAAQAGDIETAMRQYQSVAQDHGSGANNLAVLLLDRGELRAAVDALEASIRLEPDIAIAYQNLGVAYQQLGQRDAANRAFREALRINPSLAVARYHLGMEHLSRRDYLRAGMAFEQVLEQDPACAPAYLGLGLVYREIGDLPRAVDAFHRATQLDPTSWTAQFQLGRAQAELGRLAESRAALLKVLELDPPQDLRDRVGIMLAGGSDRTRKEVIMESGP